MCTWKTYVLMQNICTLKKHAYSSKIRIIPQAIMKKLLFIFRRTVVLSYGFERTCGESSI